MIIIALGANLPSDTYGPPAATLEAALNQLESNNIRVITRSSWYETEPVPSNGQPWYVNGVAVVDTELEPRQTLTILHGIEAAFGRVRQGRWEARTIDLDLLAHGSALLEDDGRGGLILPHPRMHLRRFVLAPLAEIAPNWVHPQLHRSAADLLATLPAGEVVRLLR